MPRRLYIKYLQPVISHALLETTDLIDLWHGNIHRRTLLQRLETRSLYMWAVVYCQFLFFCFLSKSDAQDHVFYSTVGTKSRGATPRERLIHQQCTNSLTHVSQTISQQYRKSSPRVNTAPLTDCVDQCKALVLVVVCSSSKHSIVHVCCYRRKHVFCAHRVYPAHDSKPTVQPN